MSERATRGAAAAARRLPDRPIPLRALRHHPALVDDVAAARLLASGTAFGTASGMAGELTADDVRWARAWLVCSQAAVAARPTFATADSAAPAFDARAVQPPKGLGDPARQVAILAALVDAGVLRPAVDVARADSAAAGASTRRRDRSVAPDPGVGGAGGPRYVCWAPAVCVVHAAAAEIDWPRAVAGCGREPATLLALRTLAEYLVPADAWTGVPRRDFVERTGYQQKQVRVALRRLAAADLIEADGESGRTARYRFTARALAPRWDQPGAPGPAIASSPAGIRSDPADTPSGAHQAGSSTPHLVSRPSTDRHDQQGVDVVLGGVTLRMAPGASLDVGPGAHAQIEVGADGRLSLRVQPGC